MTNNNSIFGDRRPLYYEQRKILIKSRQFIRTENQKGRLSLSLWSLPKSFLKVELPSVGVSVAGAHRQLQLTILGQADRHDVDRWVKLQNVQLTVH